MGHLRSHFSSINWGREGVSVGRPSLWDTLNHWEEENPRCEWSNSRYGVGAGGLIWRATLAAKRVVWWPDSNTTLLGITVMYCRILCIIQIWNTQLIQCNYQFNSLLFLSQHQPLSWPDEGKNFSMKSMQSVEWN